MITHTKTDLKGSRAVVTGASSGIGDALSKELAARGASLILTARRTDRLEALKSELESRHAADVQCIGADLAAPGGAQQLFDSVRATGKAVDILINNAGFGEIGPFAEIDPARQLDMIALNIRALTEVTRLFLPAISGGKRPSILNVASTAAFQPGPGMSVYAATKAYVLSFTEGIAEELRPRGIKVSALCPGATRTEFFDESDPKGLPMFIKLTGMASAAEVAEFGIDALLAGRVIAVHGGVNRILAQSYRYMPRGVLRWVAARFLTQVHQ